MWVLELIYHRNVFKLDVQELIHAFECTLDGDVILKLYGDLVVDECFEETALQSQENAAQL